MSQRDYDIIIVGAGPAAEGLNCRALPMQKREHSVTSSPLTKPCMPETSSMSPVEEPPADGHRLQSELIVLGHA